MTAPSLKPDTRPDFRVIERRSGWYYVVGPDIFEGPWRYGWEAQERADELNAGVAK